MDLVIYNNHTVKGKEVRTVTIQEKEAVLKDFTNLPEADFYYILGWCARAAAEKQSA